MLATEKRETNRPELAVAPQGEHKRPGPSPEKDPDENPQRPPVPPDRRPVHPVKEPPPRPGRDVPEPPIEDPEPDRPRKL